MVKTALKVDLADGVSAELDLPSVDLKYFSSGNKFVIFFDDVERSGMDPKELLGYINHYVENQGQKVVLVANESELLSDESYTKTREKVIGPSVQVATDAATAVRNFADEVGDGRLDDYVGLATELFTRSEYNNLRHVRQIFIELSRVLGSIDMDLLDEATASSFVYCYLAFNIEYRQGSITRSVLEDYPGLGHMAHGGEDAQGLHKLLVNKYPDLTIADRILPFSGWACLLGANAFHAGDLNQMLASSSLVNGEKTPIWLRLWEWSSRSDKDIAALVREAIDSMEKEALTDPREALHIYGALLSLSENGMSRLPLKKAETLARKFIRNFFNKGGVVEPEDRVPFRRSWSHHCYQTDEKSEGRAFKRLYDYFAEQRDKTLAGLLPEKNERLLEFMQKDIPRFIDAIYGRVDGFDFSGIVFIPSYGAKFARVLAGLTPVDSHRVREAMKFRYRAWVCHGELSFVDGVLGELKKEIARRQGRVSAEIANRALFDFEEIRGSLASN